MNQASAEAILKGPLKTTVELSTTRNALEKENPLDYVSPLAMGLKGSGVSSLPSRVDAFGGVNAAAWPLNSLPAGCVSGYSSEYYTAAHRAFLQQAAHMQSAQHRSANPFQQLQQLHHQYQQQQQQQQVMRQQQLAAYQQHQLQQRHQQLQQHLLIQQLLSPDQKQELQQIQMSKMLSQLQGQAPDHRATTT